MSDAMDVTDGGPGCGFAALAVGDLGTAPGIAHFLARLCDAQPALPNRFYHVWSRRRQAIITEADPEFAVMHLDTLVGGLASEPPTERRCGATSAGGRSGSRASVSERGGGHDSGRGGAGGPGAVGVGHVRRRCSDRGPRDLVNAVQAA